MDASGAARRLASANLGLPRPLAGLIPNESGRLDFRVTESSVTLQDGTAGVLLDVQVSAPAQPSQDAPGIPIVGLSPSYQQDVHGFGGSSIVYYAVSAINAGGGESGLSFIVRAAIPDGPSTYSVTLNELSFPSQAASFHVYRGISPQQLTRVATSQPLSTSFTDANLLSSGSIPPDANYDHSNLYWRLESEGEVAATIHSASTAGNESLRMIENSYSGFAVRILSGKGEGQERIVATNSQTVLTLTAPWETEPNATSTFAVSQAAFQAGGSGTGDRFQFQIPNRAGTIVQLLGLSANAAGVECPAELSPLTRWKIGGAGIKNTDPDIPPAPLFSLAPSPSLNGSLVLSGVGFATLTNTSSITAGTLCIHYQDELLPLIPLQLSADASAEDTTLQFGNSSALSAEYYIQMQQELIHVDAINADGSVRVSRALFGTAAGTFTKGETANTLKQRVTTVPFIRNFFGTPASGDWSYTMELSNARIAAAEFYVTNSQGNSPASRQAYTATLDRGLRTMSGGQYSFQVFGPLAVQNGAVSEVVLEVDHTIGDVIAYLGTAAAGDAVSLQLTANSIVICTLTFSAGTVVSNQVRGADLPPLRKGDRLGLDVLGVGSSTPGNDLTVVIRV